jgi:hypothetical protein
LQNLLLASIEVILLLLVLIECYKLFKPIHPTAAKLFIPYIAWVSFASLLTLSIFYINKTILKELELPKKVFLHSKPMAYLHLLGKELVEPN